MPKKFLVRIKEDAFVEDAKGRLTGEQEFDEKEAQRLIDLKVATLIKEVSEKVEEEPTASWLKDDITAYLKKKKIEFDEKATKEVLLTTYEEWKKSAGSKQ